MATSSHVRPPAHDAVRQDPHTARVYATVASVGTLILVAMLWFLSDGVPVDQKVLASIISLIAVVPFVLYFFDPFRPMFPLMATNCVFYLIAFGINGFYNNIPDISIARTIDYKWQEGLAIGISGLLAQCFGYYLCRSFLGRRAPIRIVAGISSERIRFLAWLLIGIRLLVIFIPDVNDIPTLNQFLKVAPFTSMAMLFMLSIKRQLPKFEQLLLYIFILPYELIQRLNTGAVYEPVLIIVLLLFIRWIITGKSNVMIIIVGTLIFVIFNPVKMEYRNVVWYTSAGKEMTSIEKLTLFLELAGNYWTSPTSTSRETQSNLLTRVNHLVHAAMVADVTPNRVPYWNGETLELGLYAFIPRALWPGKPKLTVGNEFGVRYGMLDETMTGTTVNLTWVVELYCNYGYPAVFVGMALIGIAFALLERWFCTPGTALIDVIIPLSSTFLLVYPESNIMMMWGGVLTSTAAFYALTWAVKR